MQAVGWRGVGRALPERELRADEVVQPILPSSGGARKSSGVGSRATTTDPGAVVNRGSGGSTGGPLREDLVRLIPCRLSLSL